MPIITHLKKTTYFLVALVVAFLFFGVNYYLMANLPGEQNKMCVIGAGLTSINIFFALLISICAGIAFSGFMALAAQKRTTRSFAISSLPGVGVVVGTFTVFCTLCTLPVISLFGFSFGFGFFTDYNVLFKAISFVFAIGGLYLLNGQLRDNCVVCRAAGCK